MYKIDYKFDLDYLLRPLHEFVIDILEFVNEDSTINKTLETQGDKIEEQIKILLGELKSMEDKYKFASIASGSNLKKHLYFLKFEEENLQILYEELTKEYRNILLGTIAGNDTTRISEFTKVAFIYFYESLVRTRTFVKTYCPESIFDPMFELRKKMTERKLCPYCNMHRMEFDLTSIDHFLPKTKYPLLSIFPENLVVACSACNDRIKSDKISLPIMHPYYDEVSEYFKFNFNFDEEKVEVEYIARPDDLESIRVKNFLELFNIINRYNTNVFKDLLEFKAKIRNEVRRVIKKSDTLSIINTKGEYFDRLRYEKNLLHKNRHIEHFSKVKLDLINYLESEGWVKEINYINNRPSVF